ncbi:hypothetical protein D9M71_759360 [compost metagenome]
MFDGDIVDPRQCRIDGGVTQSLGIDIDGSDLCMARGPGDEQGANAATTPDVHRLLNRQVTVLQMVTYKLGKSIAVRPEEHRIAVLGGIAAVQ